MNPRDLSRDLRGGLQFHDFAREILLELGGVLDRQPTRQNLQRLFELAFRQQCDRQIMIRDGRIGAARQRAAEVQCRVAPVPQSSEGATEIGVGIRVTWLERDGPPVVCHGFVHAALSGKH